MTSSRPSSADWSAFAVCVLTWSSAYACVRMALQADAEPWTIVAGRMWIATAALHLYLWMRRAAGKEPPPTPNSLGKLIGMGLVGAAAPFALLSWAQTRIDSGLVGILAALTPILVGVTGPMFAREERLTSGRIVGLVLGFAGVVVLMGPEAIAGLGGPAFLGQFAAAAGAVCYAANALMGRRGVDIPPLEAAAGWTLWGAIFSTPFAIWTWAGPPLPMAWIMITVLALGATGIGGIAYFMLLRSVGPTFVSQTNYLLPVGAVAFGAALFGERLDWNAAAALVLIGLGLITTQDGWRRFERFLRRPA